MELDIDRMLLLSCWLRLVWQTLWLHLDLVLYFLKNFVFNGVYRVLCLFWFLLSSWKDMKAHHVCSCEPSETIITHPREEKANCWCYTSVIKQKWFGSLGMLRGTPCARCAVPLVQLRDRYIRTLTHTLTASLYCSSPTVISSAVLENPLGTYSGKRVNPH